MTLTALELVDILIGRVAGTAHETLAREVRAAIAAEQFGQPVAGVDQIRICFDVASMACGIPPSVDLTRRFARNGRHAPVHRARHLAMYLLFFCAKLSMRRIADEFGVRDHSTVHHGVEKIKELRSRDASFDARVRTAMAQCEIASDAEGVA